MINEQLNQISRHGEVPKSLFITGMKKSQLAWSHTTFEIRTEWRNIMIEHNAVKTTSDELFELLIYWGYCTLKIQSWSLSYQLNLKRDNYFPTEYFTRPILSIHFWFNSRNISVLKWIWLLKLKAILLILLYH